MMEVRRGRSESLGVVADLRGSARRVARAVTSAAREVPRRANLSGSFGQEAWPESLRRPEQIGDGFDTLVAAGGAREGSPRRRTEPIGDP